MIDSYAAPTSALATSIVNDPVELERRAHWAAQCLRAVFVTDCACIMTGVGFGVYLAGLDPSANVADVAFASIEIADALASVLQLLAIFVSAVAFLRWFSLLHKNAAAFPGVEMKHASKWTYWGFFVPFLNLVRPSQVMRDIWDRCEERWSALPERVVGQERPQDSVSLWWGWFLATNLLGNFSARIYWRAETAEETIFANLVMIFGNLVDLVAAAMAIRIVERATRLQRPILGDRSLAGVSGERRIEGGAQD